MKVANTSYIRIFSINVYEKIYIVTKHVHISYGYNAIAFNVDVSDIATIAI